MSLSDIEYERINKITSVFIEKHRPPVELRDEVDLSFQIEEQSVIIYEIRPNWNNPAEKMESYIAKATFNKKKNLWKIYWQRADLKWHAYKPLLEVISYEDFLKEIESDRYGCFFG